MAVGLLWLLMAIPLPALYSDYRQLSSYEEIILATIVVVPLLALVAFINVQISRGRNWARIVFLAMVVITFLVYLIPGAGAQGASALDRALPIVALILDIVILYLLFSRPGASWFRPRT